MLTNANKGTYLVKNWPKYANVIYERPLKKLQETKLIYIILNTFLLNLDLLLKRRAAYSGHVILVLNLECEKD